MTRWSRREDRFRSCSAPLILWRVALTWSRSLLTLGERLGEVASQSQKQRDKQPVTHPSAPAGGLEASVNLPPCFFFWFIGRKLEHSEKKTWRIRGKQHGCICNKSAARVPRGEKVCSITVLQNIMKPRCPLYNKTKHARREHLCWFSLCFNGDLLASDVFS